MLTIGMPWSRLVLTLFRLWRSGQTPHLVVTDDAGTMHLFFRPGQCRRVVVNGVEL